MERFGNDALTDDTANPRRVRLALVVLLVGVGILLVAVGVTVLRGDASYDELIAAQGGSGHKPNDQDRAMAATLTLVYGSVLLLVFVLAAVALVMASRRYRKYLGATRPAPTASDDVWSRHQVPEGADIEADSADDAD